MAATDRANPGECRCSCQFGVGAGWSWKISRGHFSPAKSIGSGSDLPTDDSIGLYHCYLKEYREAMEAVERVLSLGPDADAYCVLAASLGGLGDHEGAIRAARQALELEPEFPEAWYNLGNAYFETGRFEEAAASLQKVFQLGRGIPDAHVLLGLTFLKLGRESA